MNSAIKIGQNVWKPKKIVCQAIVYTSWSSYSAQRIGPSQSEMKYILNNQGKKKKISELIGYE